MDDSFDIFITKFKVNNIEKYKEIILTEKIDNLGLDLGWEVLDRKYLDGSVVELKVKILNEKYDIFKPLNIFAKYLLPWSGSITTTTSFSLSLFFSWITPDKAAPHEYPARIPSFFANSLVMSAAFLSVTFSNKSINSKSTFFGIISSPIPSVMYG